MKFSLYPRVLPCRDMLKEEILRHLENDSLYHGSDSLQNLELNAWALLFGLLYEMTEISSL